MSYEIRFKNPMYTGLYGVRFDGTHSQGTRLGDCRHLKFQMETDTDELIDRYAERPGPFHLRECVSVYNSSTGKQEILGYEDDTNWDSIKDSGNRMIEFPKFWYKRPNAWEFWVSDHDEPGFLPSPMHYRNGKFYDYVYISRYRISTAFESKAHQSYLRTTTNDYQEGTSADSASKSTAKILNYRNGLRAKGMYVIDYPAYCMFVFLVLIKYGIMNFDRILDYAAGISDTGGLDIKKDSKKYKSVYNNMDVYDHRILGIDSPFGTGFYVDGIMKDNQNNVYIYPNIENLPTNSFITSFSGWTKCSKSLPFPVTSNATQYYAKITSLVYDTSYPYMVYPGSVGAGFVEDYSVPTIQRSVLNTSTDPIGDTYAYVCYNSATINGYYIYNPFICCAQDVYGRGLLSHYTIYFQTASGNWNTTLGMFFSDSYTT